MHEGDGSLAKTLGKSLLMTGALMIWLASSDFSKVPSVKALSANTLLSEEK